MKKRLFAIMAVLMLALTACGGGKQNANAELDLNAMSLADIEAKAKEEGHVESVGMPDTWANWVDTWTDINEKYGITHADTDMSSAEEIALFEQEKNSPTKDIGDVGQSFGPIVKEKNIGLKYKTSYWDEIPDWAKDDEGVWMVSYYGTMAFITNTDKVANPPKSFEDLKTGDYMVTVGDVNAATQAQNAVLSAAYAMGGDEKNIQPGLDLFADIAAQGRLDVGDTSLARIEKGEIEVGLFWDFNALNYSNSVMESNPNAKFDVTIPSDGAVQSGYATIINAYAPHPHAAALTREYILSDEGQINLAKGYARPIRKSVELPDEVKNLLLDDALYTNAKPIEDTKAWDETSKALGGKWQSDVITKIKR